MNALAWTRPWPVPFIVLAAAAVRPDPSAERRAASRVDQQTAVRGTPGEYESGEADVMSGDVSLRVRITLPDTMDPCPAFVYVHGSGKVDRLANPGFTRMFLEMGIAVAAYDKRGVGDSTGVYRMGGPGLFEQLAGDAAAVYRWLVRQPGVDATRVGFVGGSQAGWIMPLAASLVSDPAFVVAISGPSVSGEEEGYYSEMTRDGGAGGMSIAQANFETAEFEGRAGYDPRPVLRDMETPALWLFGALDESVPAHVCIVEFSKIVVEGNRNHTLHVIPGVDHNLRDTETRRPYPLRSLVSTWLRIQGIVD